MKLKLKESVVFGSEVVSELEFRDKAKAKDLLGVKLSEIDLTENVLKVAGRLCGRPTPFMEMLDAEDVLKLAEYVGGFFLSGRKTGTDGSPSSA